MLRRDEDQCHTPGCRFVRGYGKLKDDAGRGLFCQPCAEVLARIRDEYEAEEALRKDKAASTNNGGKTQDDIWSPTCCNPYCTNERPPGQPFCEDCAELGEVEEAA